LIFTVGGFAVLVGIVVLAIGLIGARIASVWAAACLPVGTIVDIVGFGASSRSLVAASSVILLAGFARLASAQLQTRHAPRAQAHAGVAAA
jgi:hypothetical protein